MRFRGIGVTTVVLGLVGACSPDYSAVRDWSAQARDSMLPITVDRMPAGSSVLPVPPAPVTADGRLGAVLALQEGAAAWLGLLSYIADDGWPRQRTNPLTDLVAKVQPFDPEGAAALANLGETMAFAARRNWRAPYLAYAVDRGDPFFQDVIASLRRQTEALAADARPGPEVAAPALPRNATELQRAALAELDAQRRAEQTRRDTAQSARRAAVERVAEGHALMKQRIDTLAQSETARLLRAQEIELRRLMLLSAAG